MTTKIDEIIQMGGYAEITTALMIFLPILDGGILAVFLEPKTQIKILRSDESANQTFGQVVKYKQAHVVGDFKGTELEKIIDNLMDRLNDIEFFTSAIDLEKALYVPMSERHDS